MNVTLKPFQYDFVYSKARHPAFVGGWNTGKTMCAIGRSRIYSKLIPDNLGVIFRKTFRSLSDSTLKDFEKYTGLSVSGDRTLVDPNGSITMFRHIDELDSINQQNINLGWFYIEQGEELEDSEPFFMLFGRLRRQLIPTDDFIKLGLSTRSGWVIGNAGDHWMKPLWKDGKLAESAKEVPEFEGKFCDLIEATTWDNKENAAPDFLASLKILQIQNPILYRQFVENDWGVSVRNKVFTKVFFELAFARHGLLSKFVFPAGVAVDPAGEGVDDNIFMAGCSGDIVGIYTKPVMSPTEKAIRAVEMCQRIDGNFIIVDCDGLGIETYSELCNLDKNYLKGIEIIKFHGSAPSEMLLINRAMYANKRSEAAFISQKRVFSGRASINPEDKILIEELEADEFFNNSRGLLQIIPKDEIKVRIKRSPGRADCWKMLQWAFEQNIKNNTYYDTQPLPREAVGSFS
jgi:hypothetical protein